MLPKVLFVVALSALVLSTVALAGEDAYIELLREDVRAEKIAIITEVMQFTDYEAARFWPVYREYERQLNMIVDDRIRMIKDFADRYGNFDDRASRKIAEQSFRLESRRTALKRKFFPRFEKAVGAKTAAQYFQLERQISLLVELQIAAELPLID